MLWLIQDESLNSSKIHLQFCLVVVAAAFDGAPGGGLCGFILLLTRKSQLTIETKQTTWSCLSRACRLKYIKYIKYIQYIPRLVNWAMPVSWGRAIWSFPLFRFRMGFDIENLEMRISEAKKIFCVEVKHTFVSLRIPCPQTLSNYMPSPWLCWGMKRDGQASDLKCFSYVGRGESRGGN